MEPKNYQLNICHSKNLKIISSDLQIINKLNEI
jgi:hypothetical protein